MPSLFSRSHQAPKKDRTPAVLVKENGADRRIVGMAKTWNGNGSSAVPSSSSIGEFGTVPQIHVSRGTHPSTPEQATLHVGGPTASPSSQSLMPMPYAFLPTQVPLSAQSLMSEPTQGQEDVRQYGFLAGAGRNVVLGLDEVARVIRDVGGELGRRALDTPLLFSNQSLELNQTRMRLLIKTFLGTVRSRTPTKTSLETFMQDIKFASDHELAWLLRWSLSRLTRVRDGIPGVAHGCVDWDTYEEWRGRERASKYPLDAFPNLQAILAPDIFFYIINPLFTLLSRFAAHSHKSGLTPHALASSFAPLLFDIPTNSPCLTAHHAFVRAASATEHMLLAFIRSSGGGVDGLGLRDLPSRLQEWIKGYPSMIASDADLARGRPRRAARVVRCEVASRTVRAYSRDLVVNAEEWVHDIPTGWGTWDRVVLKRRRGEGSRPKFSASWRRKMAVKETLPLPASAHGRDERVTYGAPLGGGPPRPVEKDEGEEGRYASLAGKEWSAFEEGGFDAPKTSLTVGSRNGDAPNMQQRLQFDLNESAKMSVAERRQTMDWTDFAAPSGGFTRTEPFLTASLTFSAPVQSSITEWPKERDELRRRLQKTQKEATPFHHDTTPRTGPACGFEGADPHGRIYVEEAFVDCWTDLMIGAGWTDRDELTFKEASWALIEYKALPKRPEEHDAVHPSQDPRTTEVYILFEERVPMDYQLAVADPKRKKSLHKLFTRKEKKTKSPSSPLPFDPRLAPRDDFDKMLNRGNQRKMTLQRNDQSVSSALWQAVTGPSDVKENKVPPLPGSPSMPMNGKPPKPVAKSPVSKSPTKATAAHGLSSPGSVNTEKGAQSIGNGRPNIFKSIRRVKSGSDNRERARRQREVSMDFEIQSASGLSSGNNSPQDGVSEEKWMDILIANGARPMDQGAGKAHTPSPPRDRPILPTKPGRRITPPSSDLTPTATHFNALNLTPGKSVPGALASPVQLGRSESREPIPMPHDDVPEPIYDHGQGNSYTHSHSSYDRSRSSSHTSAASTDDASVQPSDSISVRRRRAPSPPQDNHSEEREVLAAEAEPAPRSGFQGEYDGLIAPRPRTIGDRDAIFSIVDRYRDSQATEYSEMSEDPYGGIAERDSIIERTFESERVNSAYGGIAGERDSIIENTFASERGNSAYSITEDFTPPGPIFDLTPGREPSPARYKHGEPLHFVGEEDEEE